MRITILTVMRMLDEVARQDGKSRQTLDVSKASMPILYADLAHMGREAGQPVPGFRLVEGQKLQE